MRTLRITEQAKWEGVSFRSRWGQAPATYASFLLRGPHVSPEAEKTRETESQESERKRSKLTCWVAMYLVLYWIISACFILFQQEPIHSFIHSIIQQTFVESLPRIRHIYRHQGYKSNETWPLSPRTLLTLCQVGSHGRLPGGGNLRANFQGYKSKEDYGFGKWWPCFM